MNNRLYFERTKCRMTQSELARRAGVSRTTVCMLERHGGYPTMRVARAICGALGCGFLEVFPVDLPML